MSRRWSRKQIVALISQLMGSDLWHVVTHRSFRQYLTPEQNRFINKAVKKANFDDSVEVMRALDVTTTSDAEFFDRIPDEVWDDVIRRISSCS